MGGDFALTLKMCMLSVALAAMFQFKMKGFGIWFLKILPSESFGARQARQNRVEEL